MRVSWKEMQDEVAHCQKCALGGVRNHPAFGEGNPFVGRGGQLLDDMLSLIGLSRESNFYIANIVKCRPPQNRDPLNTEQDACLPYLEEQICLLQPKIIICLGRVAAQRLIKPEFKISQEHGHWFRRGDALITAIYHPAALLRDPSKKPETFVDLREIRQKIREVCPGTYSG